MVWLPTSGYPDHELSFPKISLTVGDLFAFSNSFWAFIISSLSLFFLPFSLVPKLISVIILIVIIIINPPDRTIRIYFKNGGIRRLMQYGKNRVGKNAQIYDPVTLGFPSREYLGTKDFPGVTIGDDTVIRSGSIIYCEVTIGNRFQCGHNVLIREKTVIGNNTSVGTASIIEGYSSIGNNVRIQSMVFVPTNTEIADGVFIGPGVVLTNDRYPPTRKAELKGPVLEENSVIGAKAVILPGIRIGQGAFVAAGSVVTHDVPAGKMAIGSPAKVRDMPQEMVRD